MSLLRFHIDPLLDQLETQRGVVDGRLTAPARWSGPIRSSLAGRDGKRRQRHVERAFNDLVKRQRDHGLGELTTQHLLGIHAAITGGGGIRAHGARIGEFVIHHRVADLRHLVEEALVRANDGYEPPLLAAARLHMELLLIHPFSDGNGRTSRLASSWVLLRAGCRSTLPTAVEQHARLIPGSYFRSFRLLRTSRPTQHSEWLRTALIHQAEASRYAWEFRMREQAMRDMLTSAGVESRRHERILIDHESGISTVNTALLKGFPRWSDMARSIPVDGQRRARTQIERLLREEGRPNRRRGQA